MTYRGERAHELADEHGRVFEVTKVRLSMDGHIQEVLWGEVDTASGHDVGPKVEAPLSEVVDAIHGGAEVIALFETPEPVPRKRAFVVSLQQDGREFIAFAESSVPGRELGDLSRLEPLGEIPVSHLTKVSLKESATRRTVHAVSKVRLDADGRITEVLWGPVDTARNDWAAPEVVASVGQAVDAILAGHQVFALFPSLHGHFPDRRFVVADYDGGRRTIVLAGPAAYEREVHDMDRMAAVV